MSETIQKSSGVSQAQFSIIAGVSRKTVTTWKSKGFLVFLDDVTVDVDASIALLRDRGLGNFGDVTPSVTPSETGNSFDDGPDPFAVAVERTEQARQIGDVAAEVMNSPDFELLSYADASRMKENFLALTQRLNYETKVGRLVDRSEVEADFANRWAAERNAWEVWPSTVCGDIAAQLGLDQVKVRVVLEAAVHSHLTARIQAAYDEVA
ncbi:hypothetical protein [Allorhizobium borbori]|uniref:Uncharacterized protein n=1 Tax=Allorhizobium borbori TaxID=485907 RepID=A0A7W6JZH8_9HYPH|nr:hypothetical protein [Allorhizobium borbori]MBB4102385.1 hypothetical protein [Allorhizobium borbori]